MSDVDHAKGKAAKRQPPRPPNIAGTSFRAAARKLGREVSALVRDKGVVTIPQAVRDELDLAVGDQVIVTVEDGRIVLTPTAVVPRSQAWFWTRDWQSREAEADADLAAGRTAQFDSDEEFLAALRDRA